MYDLTVIGAGWAGFSAAEYAAKNGLKVALVDKDKLGGTCLNYGCIPTKIFLNSAKILSKLNKIPQGLAIKIDKPAEIDLPSLQKRKEELINKLKGQLEFMVKSGKIDFWTGDAQVVSSQKVNIGEHSLETKYILIASGSKPQELPAIKFDGNKIISSTEALNLRSIPKKILIIGGGVVGVEFAEFFNSIGSEVEIAELAAGLLPGLDKQLSRKLEAIFKKKAVKLSLNTDASSLNFGNYDLVLLCVGRTPQSECFKDLDVKRAGPNICVNDYLQTSVPNIYAAGDCIGGYLLAHAARYEGRLAVKNIISNNTQKASYSGLPQVIFTNPQVAIVGLNEEAAREKYPQVYVKKFDFLALGMAHILDETEGFIKIIADGDENVVGGSIIGPQASELIHIIALCIQNRLKLSHIRESIFAHPSISEGIQEAVS